MKFVVEAQDLDHLNRIVLAIRRVASVGAVQRTQKLSINLACESRRMVHIRLAVESAPENDRQEVVANLVFGVMIATLLCIAKHSRFLPQSSFDILIGVHLVGSV